MQSHSTFSHGSKIKEAKKKRWRSNEKHFTRDWHVDEALSKRSVETFIGLGLIPSVPWDESHLHFRDFILKWWNFWWHFIAHIFLILFNVDYENNALVIKVSFKQAKNIQSTLNRNTFRMRLWVWMRMEKFFSYNSPVCTRSPLSWIYYQKKVLFLWQLSIKQPLGTLLAWTFSVYISSATGEKKLTPLCLCVCFEKTTQLAADTHVVNAKTLLINNLPNDSVAKLNRFEKQFPTWFFQAWFCVRIRRTWNRCSLTA